jgi:signal transduction histidine kinase
MPPSRISPLRTVGPPVLVVLTGALLVAILAAVVLRFRSELRAEMRQTIIDRAAAVLLPVAQRQLVQRSSSSAGPADLLAAVLESAQQEDMLAVAVFDARGHTLQYAPASLIFAELPIEDFIRLQKSEPISRFYPDFPLGRYFSGLSAAAKQSPTPVLEVLLPLHGQNPPQVIGFAQYYIYGQSLSAELLLIDQRINRQTGATLAIGTALISVVVAIAYLGLRRAERVIVERNERLARVNVELTLAAKASALGQITSHLIHGLQGPVASLKGMAVDREAHPAAPPDWKSVAEYADRMQEMIHDTVALLGNSGPDASFELTGSELASIVRQRNQAVAAEKGVGLTVTGAFEKGIDGHQGGLICLIVSNLVQNAVEATRAAGQVRVAFLEAGDHTVIAVSDEGAGISGDVLSHLFEPGRTGRAGGTGLGLAISQLLARQIGASLTLETTGPGGSTFQLRMPAVGI